MKKNEKKWNCFFVKLLRLFHFFLLVSRIRHFLRNKTINAEYDYFMIYKEYIKTICNNCLYFLFISKIWCDKSVLYTVMFDAFRNYETCEDVYGTISLLCRPKIMTRVELRRAVNMQISVMKIFIILVEPLCWIYKDNEI